MTVTINGTTGVVYPDGVTQGSGVPTASATSGAPLVSNGTVYTQTTAVGVAFGGTGANSAPTARTNLGLGTIATQDANNVSITGGTVSVTSVTGNGSALTAINASNVSSGTIATARLGTGTANSTTFLRGDGTWNAPAGGVTSAVAGNGIAVSGATGAVTFSAACPGFNTVGSYCYVYVNTSGGETPGSGSNYSAGTGTLQFQAFAVNCDPSNTLSGTWKWMSGGTNAGSVGSLAGIACRVS